MKSGTDGFRVCVFIVLRFWKAFERVGTPVMFLILSVSQKGALPSLLVLVTILSCTAYITAFQGSFYILGCGLVLASSAGLLALHLFDIRGQLLVERRKEAALGSQSQSIVYIF